MGEVLGDIAGWFARVGEELARVSLRALLVAVALPTLQTALDALAWRNVLRAAYPAGGVRYPPVFGVYAGGVALNHMLPAQSTLVAIAPGGVGCRPAPARAAPGRRSPATLSPGPSPAAAPRAAS